MRITIDRTLCVSCGACVTACPQHAIFLDKGRARVEEEKCSCCKLCIYKCYVLAIHADEGAENVTPM